MNKTTPIITRVAPSPTGYLHIGTTRTALFNYLFTKHHGGKCYLRIDDTDTERSTPEFEQDIITGLHNLGFTYDQTFKQSERSELYESKIKYLLDNNLAYISEEAPLKAGDRATVIRFRNPGGLVKFTDLILGEIVIDVTDLGDFIIAKDETSPLYHLASVIDDIDLNITHVIRGADHLSNTPRQILMLEALGGERPEYAHIPLILAPDRSKMSKRHGAVSVKSYLEAGYTKEALINFMALLGWSPQAATNDVAGTNEEIFSLEQLVDRFDLSAVQKGGAIFNIEKLNWLNREYLKRYSAEERLDYFVESEINFGGKLNHEQSILLSDILVDRAPTRKEALESLPELAYLKAGYRPTLTLELLKTTEYLPEVIKLLEVLPEADFTPENIKSAIWDFATEKGRGEVLWPMRVALTGLPKSLDPFTTASILGKTETINRLRTAQLINS